VWCVGIGLLMWSCSSCLVVSCACLVVLCLVRVDVVVSCACLVRVDVVVSCACLVLVLVPLCLPLLSCACALVCVCVPSAGVRIITGLQCNDRTQGKPLVPPQCRVCSSVPPSIWAHQGHSRAAAPQGTRGSPR